MNWVKSLIILLIVVGMTCASTTFIVDVSNGENIAEDEVLTLEINPISDVEYEVVVRDYISFLKVNVTGDHLAYEIFLYNPVGGNYSDLIEKEDIRMGNASIYMEMTKHTVKSPPKGNYTLIIKEQYHEDEHYRENITFEGSNVSIIDLQTHGDYYNVLEFGHINQLDIKFNNTGDLPLYLDEFRIHIGEENKTGNVSNFVLPGQESTINVSLYFDNIPAGTHDVLIEVFSEGVLIDSYEREITFQATEPESITIDDEVCVGPFAIMGIGAFAIPMMIARRRCKL